MTATTRVLGTMRRLKSDEIMSSEAISEPGTYHVITSEEVRLDVYLDGRFGRMWRASALGRRSPRL